jgi:hypothetical protein
MINLINRIFYITKPLIKYPEIIVGIKYVITEINGNFCKIEHFTNNLRMQDFGDKQFEAITENICFELYNNEV